MPQLAVNVNLRHPLFCRFVPQNAGYSAAVVAPSWLVLAILSPIGGPKVAQPIVITNTVDVVNVAVRSNAVDVQPRRPVRH
jgi:hypothetical protein